MIHVVMICDTWKNMSYNKPSVENKMYGTKLTQLNVCPFNLNAWRMQFLTSTYFWSCRKVSISTSPQRRIVAQNWGWRVNSRTRSVTGHPEEHLPSPPTPLLVVLWGGGDCHLWIWFCLRCLRIDWFAYLWENFVEKCIKDAHCKVSCVFLFIF